MNTFGPSNGPDVQNLETGRVLIGKPANVGYCHCCRQPCKFEIAGDWLRDQYLCTSCNSIPRQRHINLILDKYFLGWESCNLHESSSSNKFVSRWSDNYSTSHFIDGAESGSIHDGVRCENLEKLSFSDNVFDLFITQDVMEHVFNPGVAFREIMRVLKPSGAHVFTAPKHFGIRRSYPRALLDNGKIIHLKEEAYHGNPVGDGRALVTWDYGDDFEFLISQWCGYSVTTYITRDRNLGIDGEYLEVFVIKKMGQSFRNRSRQYAHGDIQRD